jgi:hypothetical protein
MRRTRKTTRFALRCETLESRQLLSLGQTGFAAGMLATPAVSSAQVSIPAIVSTFNSPSYANVEIVIGTFGGLNQIQISSQTGGGPLFSPTPSSSSGSGFSLGTLNGTSSNGSSSTGLTSNSETTSSSAITPLNPSATSGTNTTASQVYVVPAPLAPLAVHLGSSTAPATAQTNSTLISNLDEMPQMSHFGQADDFSGRRLFQENVAFKSQSSSFIDHIEPYHEIVPVAVPVSPPLPEDAPVAPRVPAISDPNIDAALDLTDGRILTRSRDGDAAGAADETVSQTNTSWSLSAIFGAAAIASGGYHLAMREADRFRGRWIPRWSGAERPTKRKRASASR